MPGSTDVRQLFESFFLAGFECASQLTLDGTRYDLIRATQHDRFAADDYARCRSVGIRAARESARWPAFDRGGDIDTTEIERLARLASADRLTLIWDLVHYGYPDDLDANAEGFGDAFTERLVAFARAVARTVVPIAGAATWWTPVNEISYTAWAGGEVGIFAPFWHGRGDEYKRILVRAAVAAFDAVRSVDPDARVLTAEPLVRLHVHPDIGAAADRRLLQAQADDFNTRVVNEAYDMLSGRVAPELGGSPEHLGVLGLNYYEGNQWTIATPEHPQHFLDRSDAAWVPLRQLLRELADRYAVPIVISETGSSGEARADWLRHLTAEAENAIADGVGLGGICLYPIVTSPDWNDPAAFFEGGLWDVEPQPDGSLARVLAAGVAVALHAAQQRLDPASAGYGAPTGGTSGTESTDVLLAKATELARFSPDGFVSLPLFAGESMVAEIYCFEPGKSVAAHRHAETEHVLTPIRGAADIRIGRTWVTVNAGESVLVPRGQYHGIHNVSSERLIVHQVSSPKPWDARFGGPRPSDVRAMRQVDEELEPGR